MVKDLLIIGSGPTGLYAWKFANNLSLSGTIIEANYEVGGQANLAYPEKTIHNLPGISEIKAKDFVRNMLDDANNDNSKIELKTNTSVVEVIKVKTPDDFKFHFLVKFSDHCQATYKSILVCEGLGQYQSIRLVDDDWENIHYVVKNKEDFNNKKVVIFGGGDSAIDWAKNLSPNANVTLIHRREEFRGPIDSIKDDVEILTPFEFKEIRKTDGKKVKSIVVANNGLEKEVKFDECLVQFGAVIKPHPLKGLNLDRNDLNKIIVDLEMSTSVPGVFAAGDAVIYPTKKRNLIFGFQEAVTALSKIEMMINHKKIANKGW
ncbi:NAD(P)/FAD-dependent oxidoreductase [Spiroplasma alleghenense]|uniref:Ferredoxin--NADP reductase n=1 Tax=Spiroplasma alleghenense TaxID=216931 RepID=A0A345Z2K7_9MOLU|nr:NAD(P)/FAD-dependent oxidoreductase [Spiroplasma alleghenense]AXK50836.1 thioredoxin reductase [Spiroplasma alleghenense]